jgi:uncharacterized protein YndB with AHSA1/START domain
MVDAREIVNVRVFEAPRAAVFEAFRDPDRLARWWGPAGFTNTMREFDLRPGGRWRIVMHGPGGDYDNESVFDQIVANERIVFRHLGPAHTYTMTLTFEDEARGKTRLTWRMLNDVEPEAQLRELLFQANEENLDRLAAELA